MLSAQQKTFFAESVRKIQQIHFVYNTLVLLAWLNTFSCFQEVHINKFLKTCHQIEGRTTSSPSRGPEGNLETLLRKSIVDLSKAWEEPLVRFLYLVLDKLVLLLVRPPIISGTVGIYQSLLICLKHGRNLSLGFFAFF